EFRKPQDDYGHHVIAVEVGIEDEVGVIANPRDKKSGGSHRLLVTADLRGAAAIALAQLAQEAREAVSEGGSGHLSAIVSFGGLDGGRPIVQSGAASAPVGARRCRRGQSVFNDSEERIAYDDDVSAPALLFLGELDRDVLFDDQAVCEDRDCNKTEQIDNQQPVCQR